MPSNALQAWHPVMNAHPLHMLTASKCLFQGKGGEGRGGEGRNVHTVCVVDCIGEVPCCNTAEGPDTDTIDL